MARADAERVCLDWISDIDPSGENTERWKNKFKAMSNDAFKAFVDSLKVGKDYISVISPNLSSSKITTENNFKIAKKRGVPMFQRIWMIDPVTKRKYLSNDAYPIFYLPVRRQIQMVRSKISVAKDNSKVDALTGQPTSSSAAGGISYPETLVLHSRGLDKSVEELIWARGGNKGAFNAMNQAVKNTGSVSLNELQQYSTGIKSTNVLSTYLKSIHIDNTI